MYYLNPISISSLLLLMSCLVWQLDAHGMMLNPVGRSSRWRYDSTAIRNYDDNALYCGGFWKQTANGGNCGLCGDDYSLATPRPNELGGKFGKGVIVRSYTGVRYALVTVHITANHLGYLSFQLCNLDKYGSESEECFAEHALKFIDDSVKYYIGTTTGIINLTVELPEGVSCKHCVMRWKYTAGNNWGTCEDGSGAVGCGAQETFVNCADISIFSSAEVLLQAELPVQVEEDSKEVIV